MKQIIKNLHRQIAVIAVATLCSGTAKAEISGAQVEAMAAHTAMQTASFIVSTLSACASAYPETRDSAVGAMEVVVPKLKSKPELPDQWIQSAAQCMDKQRTLTKAQCNRFEAHVRRGEISLNDDDMKPIVGDAMTMLSPCMGTQG
jgi:hypothetical protein